MTIFVSCKRADFSATSPLGWTVVDTVSESSGRFMKMQPPVNSSVPVFVENINISIIDFPSLDLYMSTVLSSIKNSAQYFQQKGKGTMKIKEYNADWQHHIIKAKQSSDTAEQKVYFIKYHGDIYQIVCSCKLGSMESFQNSIDTVLNSFKVK